MPLHIPLGKQGKRLYQQIKTFMILREPPHRQKRLIIRPGSSLHFHCQRIVYHSRFQSQLRLISLLIPPAQDNNPFNINHPIAEKRLQPGKIRMLLFKKRFIRIVHPAHRSRYIQLRPDNSQMKTTIGMHPNRHIIVSTIYFLYQFVLIRQ